MIEDAIDPYKKAVELNNKSVFLKVPVPNIRKSINYSCGSAAFQAVLAYWGMDINESTLIKLLNTTNKLGTDKDSMVKVARSMGLRAESKNKSRDNLSLEDLEKSIKDGVPIIVNCQAWSGCKNLTKLECESSINSWETDWDDGHYLVVIGLDGKNVYFEDPEMVESKGYIPRDEFEKRWHNSCCEPLYKGNESHVGVFIRGENPVEYPDYRRIE